MQLAEIQASSENKQIQKEVALRAIEEQENDKQRTREFLEKESTKQKRYGISVLLIMAIFILALVFVGNTQMAEKLIEIAAYTALGAFGGYGYAIHKYQGGKGN